VVNYQHIRPQTALPKQMAKSHQQGRVRNLKKPMTCTKESPVLHLHKPANSILVSAFLQKNIREGQQSGHVTFDISGGNFSSSRRSKSIGLFLITDKTANLTKLLFTDRLQHSRRLTRQNSLLCVRVGWNTWKLANKYVCLILFCRFATWRCQITGPVGKEMLLPG